MEKPLQTLHKSLLNNNYDVPEDYESFEQTLTAKGKEGFQNRYTLWKSLSDNGYDVPDNYDDFSHTLFQPAQSAAKPQQVPAPAQQKPKPQQTQTPVTSPVTAPEDDGADDPVLGTPWGTEGSATGKSKAYKPFAPGQVRTNEKMNGTDLGVPYRPDEQMTAAARDEAYRQNDFAVKQVQKIRRENTRRNQPVVDTGNPDVNKSVIKTQGQWEDELQQGANRISNSVVVPAVDKAIAEFDKKAHEVFEGTKEDGNAFGGLPTGTGSGATIFGSIKESNKANDPDKVLEYLKGQFEDLYKDQSFVEEVGKEADKMGMDRTDYLEKVIKPQIESDLKTKFDSAMIDKYLPKSGKEYVVNGLSNSIIGMLADAFLETKGQRNYKNQAAAMTEEGDNPYYTPGTGAKLAQMGVSFAADAPFFGVYGKVSGQVAKTIAEREIQKMIGKGLSEGAARSIVGSALENSVGARMKNYIMQHVISSSMTLGAYNATSESARQLRDQDFNPGQLAKSTAEGLATGAAFGVTGGAVQALSQPLTGFARVGAKLGGFAAEAETMYATEELAKMAEGEEAFENPFEGSIEAMEKLGVMKLSGGHLLGKAVETVGDIKSKGITKVAGEALGGLLGRQRTGVEFTPEEQSYIRDTAEGNDLVQSLATMHPDRAIEEVNGKKKFTKEGEQQRQQLAENYDRFMSNTEIPSTLKQKVAKMFGGIYRPGLETGADITQNEDGSVILKTRDKDGNCVRDLKFDSYEEANAWQQQNMTEFSRNDATNMWKNASLLTRQKIVDIVKGDITGTTLIADMMNQAGGMRQKRLQRELAKIEEVRQQFEGREMTDDEVRNYIQMVIKDGDDATFDQLYQIIRDQAYPADELNTKRNYWEGTQVTDMNRHYAQVAAQLAEEKLALLGQEFAEEVIGAADYPDEKMAELASRSDITKPQLEAALDYYNKSAKVNGMMDEALKNVDNQVEAANAYVRKNTHTDSGSLIEGNYQGRNYYVTAGHFQVSPDGRLVPTDNTGLVILRDKETGEIVTANPNDIQVTGIQDPNRIIEYNESMEGLRGQLIKQADDSIELNPDTPTEAANGDIYMGADGKQYMAMQIQDETGNPVWAKIAIDETGNPVGNPMPFDMEEYRKAKSDQIDLAEMPQEAVVDQMEAVIEQNQSENAQTGENYAQKSPENIQSSDLDNAGAEASAANGTGAYDAPAPALSRIPVDEKGRKIYEQAKPEDTLAELTEKYGEEKAQQMISQIAEGAEKELEKLQKTDTSTITDMADLEAHEDKVAAARAKVDYWNTISENIKNKNAKKVWENLENPKEIRNFATDPESQTQWVDEHFDEIVDSYSRTHGNKLDPDDVRKAFTGIGYTGKNVDEFRKNEVRLVRAIYEKMLNDAVKSGNKSITLLTGAGGAGKSTATDQIDLSDRGVVYDSALNSFQNLERAILKAKNAGMTDIQVIAVYNDALQSFSNTLKRGLESERFLPIGYFTKAFQNNQGKIAELKQKYPDVDIMCFDNSGNKSAERPNGGRVSVEEAEKWDYTLDEEKFNELLKLIEDGINEGRFREDQLASIGRGLRDASRLVGAVTPATEARVGQLVGRISGEDVGNMRPGISGEQRESRRGDMATPADGAVQGSSDQRRNEEEPGKKPGSSDDDGPEPPAAGAAAGGSGLGQSQQHASATGGSRASATGGSGNGPASVESDLSPAKAKVYQKAVEANIGRTFTFSYGNGTKSVLKVLRIDHNGNTVVTRQDYDTQGHPIGSPVEERYDFRKVGKAIAENTWKKELDTDEKLRNKYKFDKFKSGDVPIIDVLTDEEKRQILNAYERGDKEAVGNLTGDFIELHREDIILRGRDLRNEKVDKAFARNGRGERLRGVRDQYRGYQDAENLLSDEAMQPQTIEEYVAEALGDVPKMGNGFLAYTSYDQGGNTIVGLKDETGFGSRGFAGDTKGFNPWLAPNGKGISLKQFAESIHESLPEGLKQQYSDQDLRNIIWNVLTSAEKPTDISNYILRNRVEQAEAATRHMEDMAMDAPSFQKVYGGNSFASRLQRGKESVNTEPTESQKEAGNYKKGHISFGGYDFTIENPEGSVRRGTDADGKQWEQKMNNTYGYILGKRGKDGDHLDMFINDKADLDNWNGNVYVVDQVDPKTGKFDEHKIMYGFNSEAEAREAYLSNYEKGWKGLGKITGVDKQTFDKWLDASDYKIKDFADYSIVKHKVERQMTNFDTAMKELNTRGISIDNQDLLDKYGLKNVVLSKTGDHITLTHFIVDQQGQGYGSRFMEDLARLADENGYTLALTPGLGFGAKSKKRLTDFYKRFGFVPNKGRNADFETREAMIRRPKEILEKPENQEKVIRDAVVEYLKSKGIEVSTDWKLGQKILDDYNKNLEVNEEPEEAIKSQKVSVDDMKQREVRRDDEESKVIFDAAKNLFGTTNDIREAGYILPDGTMLDFSGRHLMDPGSDTSFLNGRRTSDHREIGSIAYEKDGDTPTGIDTDMKDFIERGAIRIDNNAGSINLYMRPTEKQKAALKKLISNNNGDVQIDFGNGWDSEHYTEYDGAKQNRVLSDIDKYYTDGIKPEGNIKFFKTPDGQAYGYTYQNKIYMDPRIATAETPIHEYGHLYCAMKRQTDPEGWKEWKQVMLNDEVAKPIIDRVKRDYPELAKEGKDDDFAEEIITQFSGKRGSERLREIAEEVAKEKGGIFGKAEAVTAMQRLKSILNRFWEGVAKMMGWKYTNANQIADKIMADMLNGVDPTKIAKDNSGKLSTQAEIERTLMGVHNLSEDKLRKVLKQGGLANPSLAVVDTKNHMHTDYGDISLIPKSSLIASSTGRNAGTFTADAWTPTYPQVQRLMSDKGQSLFWKDIRSLNDEAGEVANHMRMAFDTWLDKEVGQERLAYWYMKERGMNPELVLNKNPYGEDIVKRIDELTDNGNLEVSRLPEDQIKEIADMYHVYKESIGEPVTPAKERIEKLQARIDPEKQSPFTKLQQYRLDELKKYGELLHNLNDFEYAVRRSAFSDGKPNVEATVDKAAKAVKDQNLQQDFEKWLQEKADRYGVEEKLWNGTDSQGRNRYLPNTLENASKLMKKEGLNGATNWSSIGNWIAKVANKEKTLGGIRKNRKNLNTTKEEHEAFHEEWGQKLRAIAEKLGKGDWWNGDNILSDALDHYKNISSYLKREYDYDLSAEDRQTIEQFVKEVQTNFPTGYFETKFERPVYLNEFEIAVVPENTSPEVVEALKNAGLDVRTYDDTGTEDQKDANRKQATMDAVSGRDDIMFQMVGKEGAREADKNEGSDERSRNLTLAEDSEKAGVDPKAIKLATGWERGADGQWRYEIPDADVDIIDKYNEKYSELAKKGVARPVPTIDLDDLLGKDNELFKYYPELRSMPVQFSETLPNGTSGSYDGNIIKINAEETTRFDDKDLNNENVYGTLLHEVQHAIQDIEGFAKGGNLRTSTTEAGINAIVAKKEAEKIRIKTELDAINKILSSSPEEKKDYAELAGKTVDDYMFYLDMQAANMAQKYDRINSYIEKIRHDYAPSLTDAKDLYHSLAGEVEARNVTDRMNMTDEERRNSLASETEDVPREDQVIIKGEGDESASMGDSSETFNESKKAQENENNSIKFQRTGSPEPEMTAEERQYWNQWSADMKKWRERYAIPETATGPSEKPAYQRGESALDYAQKLVNWNRERSIWQTAPKLEDYRQKREDKDLLESARENEKRYPDSPSAKMRRVAAEFAQIRHSMSQQKAYDKATVKAVTDFAHEFMKLGFGDNLSRGEIERMLSSVKNATGSTDIKKNIDNIMNILMDNHLRNLENQVVKLSSTKELSKTAQGVEKQGKLELKGQRMIQAFREARQERMSVEDIRNRMAEVAEKMNRNDEEAPMWEQEYEGLSIALQYAENVEASRQEWAGLDQIYKDAVKDYKNSGRSYKAQQELLESIEQAMQENKIERIGMYGDVINRLEGNIAESMQGAKEFVEREKQRIKHIQDIANFDLAGKDMGAIHQSDWKKRLSNGSAARFFLSPLATFEQMLKQFGIRNANGEGYLYDHFMRSWMDSVDKSFENEQKAKEELDAKAREVFGDKVKRWSDLYKLERTLPTAEVEIIDQGEPKTFTLNQGNLLYIYMADKMSDGRMKLRKMGIDEDKVQQIADFLDPRIKQLGDWLQGEYLPKKRTAYNKVHERMFGAPMAAIDNYFPIKILGDARIQEQDVANMADQDAVLPSTITGSIVKRRKNALPLDILGTDALSLAVEHIEDMERWAAQAEWNKDVNTLLSYTTFRNKVKNMNTIYGSGDQLWNTFADTARMAAGTYRPKAKPGSVDKTISNIAKGVTAAKINFRVYTAFKQILSAPAFLHDVNLGTFVKNSANPYGSWKWAMENMPVFQKRWKSRQVGDTRLMDDPTDWKMWKTNVVQLATRMGMSPNALVDGVTCAVGARSIYETRYKQYKDIGASDEVARKRAMQDAEIGYNLTQQSSEGAFVSAIQKDRTVAANMLSVFRNSSMAYTRQWVDAARNLSHRAQKGYKEDSIRFMASQLEERFGLEPDQAKKVAESQYARAARHDVARLLNMMFGVTTAWNLGASLPYLLFGDDDHTKEEMLKDAAIKGFIAGPTEGLAAGNIYSDFIGRTLASEQTRKTALNEGWGAGIDAALKQGGDYEVNPLPLMADIQSMIKKMGYDKYAAAQDVFNICMQSAVGVNPQTFTDMWNACMDYGNPEWMPFTNGEGNNDLANSKEIALFIMRLMNAPTSSWRNKYIDELGMNVEDAKKLPYEEMARRYANYKHWKDAPIMGWLRDGESRADKMKKIQKQFDKAVEERMERLTDDELKHNVMRSESIEERRKYAKIIANRLGVTPGETSKKQDESKWYQEVYQEKMQYDDIREDETLATKYREYREKDSKDKTKKEVKKLLDKIRKEKKQFDTNGDEKANDAIMQNIRKWRKEALEILLRAEAE